MAVNLLKHQMTSNLIFKSFQYQILQHNNKKTIKQCYCYLSSSRASCYYNISIFKQENKHVTTTTTTSLYFTHQTKRFYAEETSSIDWSKLPPLPLCKENTMTYLTTKCQKIVSSNPTVTTMARKRNKAKNQTVNNSNVSYTKFDNSDDTHSPASSPVSSIQNVKSSITDCFTRSYRRIKNFFTCTKNKSSSSDDEDDDALKKNSKKQSFFNTKNVAKYTDLDQLPKPTNATGKYKQEKDILQNCQKNKTISKSPTTTTNTTTTNTTTTTTATTTATTTIPRIAPPPPNQALRRPKKKTSVPSPSPPSQPSPPPPPPPPSQSATTSYSKKKSATINLNTISFDKSGLTLPVIDNEDNFLKNFDALPGKSIINKVRDRFQGIKSDQQILIDGMLPTQELVADDFSYLLNSASGLTSNLVDVYLTKLKARNQFHRFPTIGICQTPFAQTLFKEKPDEAFAEIFRDENLLDNQILMVPVLTGDPLANIRSIGHFTLLVVDFAKRKIVYLDSLGSSGNMSHPGLVSNVRRYLEHCSKVEKKVEFEWSNWCQFAATNLPLQNNGLDCGVFLCKFADCYSRRVPLSFACRDIDYIRYAIGYQLLNWKFN